VCRSRRLAVKTASAARSAARDRRRLARIGASANTGKGIAVAELEGITRAALSAVGSDLPPAESLRWNDWDARPTDAWCAYAERALGTCTARSRRVFQQLWCQDADFDTPRQPRGSEQEKSACACSITEDPFGVANQVGSDCCRRHFASRSIEQSGVEYVLISLRPREIAIASIQNFSGVAET
jgi:hypothetical protein